MNASSQKSAEEPDRVRRHTHPVHIRKIDEATASRVMHYAVKPDEELNQRIWELQREWDMERWLETTASTMALVGTSLGAFKSKRWLILPLFVTGFLFQHAVQGWCPPVSLFRRLGVRTREEIARELYALKALRGDFKDASEEDQDPSIRALEALKAVKAG